MFNDNCDDAMTDGETMDQNENPDDERITGLASTIMSKVAPKKQGSETRQRALPPTLNRPRRHSHFPHVNTNVLLVRKYGQAKLDQYTDREQRELLGSAFKSDDDQNYDVANPT